LCEPPARPESAGAAIAGTAAATAAILLSGVVTGLIAARSLGAAGRGELAAMTVWASTFLYAGTLGLPEAVTYFSAAEPSSRERVWTTAQVAAGVLGLLVTLLGWWVIPLLFSADDAALAESIRWFLLFYAIPCLCSLCACAWLQGTGRLRAFNVSRLTIHVVNAGGMVILLLLGDQLVLHFAAVLLIGNTATCLLAVGLGPVARVGAAPPSIGLAKRLLHYGMRVQVGNWSNAASVRLDQLLLSLFAAAASLGLYVVAVTYASVLLTIPGSAALVLLPHIVRQQREGTARACLERWYRRLLWATVLGGTLIALSGAVLIPALFGRAFQAAVPLVALLVPATVMLGMNQVLAAAFRGIGRPEISSTSEVIGVAVTVVGLAALLPGYGIYGAAAASLLAYGSSHVYLTRRALVVFGTDMKSLCVPTRGDLGALRSAAVRIRHQPARPSEPAVSTQERYGG
jgi:O-antigen/teichoic acid export membrane protein